MSYWDLSDDEIACEGQVLMDYLKARRDFIRESAWWHLSPEGPFCVREEMRRVGEAIEAEKRRILDGDTSEPEAEPEPKQGDLIDAARGGADG